MYIVIFCGECVCAVGNFICELSVVLCQLVVFGRRMVLQETARVNLDKYCSL